MKLRDPSPSTTLDPYKAVPEKEVWDAIQQRMSLKDATATEKAKHAAKGWDVFPRDPLDFGHPFLMKLRDPFDPDLPDKEAWDAFQDMGLGDATATEKAKHAAKAWNGFPRNTLDF